MKFQLPKGETSVILTVFIQDSSATTGAGLGSLDQTSSITGGYVKRNGTGVALAVDENVTTEGTYEAPSTAAQVRIGTPANLRTGAYELHFHNDLFTTADWVTIFLGGASNMAELTLEIQLTSVDLNNSTLGNLVLDGLKDAGIILSRSAIETVNSQTEFIIPATDDPVNNDAINGATAVVIDQSDPNQRAVLLVSDYVASSRAVTLAVAAEFTVVAGDTLIILSGTSTKGVWDRILTGATHNIASSAGRRLRGVQAFGDYANGALWFDSANGVGGQVEFENATVQNPSNSLTDVLALASSLNMVRIEVAPGSTLTLDATISGFTVVGENWTLALASQDISGSYFHGADVSGIGTGATLAHFHECHFGTTNLPPCHIEFSGFEDVLTLTGAGNYFLDNCHAGVLSPALDFEDANENKNVFLSKYGGDLEVRNIGQAASTDTLHIDGNGKLILASTCEAATIEIQGNIEIEDNVAGGWVAGESGTLNDDARVDVPAVSDGVADEVLTGATHNVTNSLGRRIRELDEQVGYEGGAIWLDTNNGAAGQVVGENGTVNNPSDNITDTIALAVATGRTRIRVASGSTVTLVAALEGYEIFNTNWTLVLNGQSISGTCISGALVTGIGTGANRPMLHNCQLGAITLPPAIMVACGIGNSSGTFTFGGAGEYIYDECYSVVPGPGTPNFVATGLGSATGINNRAWKGGANYTLDSDITLSHEVLAGGGTTITTGGADVEIRGITRSVTLVLSNAGTIQFVGITGPITISGTATTTVNLYGVSSSLADTSSGTTINDETTSRANYNGGDYSLDTDANGRIRIVDGTGAGEINTNAGAIAVVDLVTDITTKTGYSLAAAGLDSIVVEVGLNARQALSIIASSGGGVLAGAATTSVTIAAAGVAATNRITATVDASGNRSVVTLSPPA